MKWAKSWAYEIIAAMPSIDWKKQFKQTKEIRVGWSTEREDFMPSLY